MPRPFVLAPIENSPPGIHTIPFGAGPGAGVLFSAVGGRATLPVHPRQARPGDANQQCICQIEHVKERGWSHGPSRFDLDNDFASVDLTIKATANGPTSDATVRQGRRRATDDIDEQGAFPAFDRSRAFQHLYVVSQIIAGEDRITNLHDQIGHFVSAENGESSVGRILEKAVLPLAPERDKTRRRQMPGEARRPVRKADGRRIDAVQDQLALFSVTLLAFCT